jgi:glycosyltransferase involved in cell wall biosynthesis
MAAGVPCVVTDVGDSARIVGDYGAVVPSRDPAALAGGWRRLLDLSDDDKESLARNCRTTIQDNYSQSVIVQKMASMYTELANI